MNMRRGLFRLWMLGLMRRNSANGCTPRLESSVGSRIPGERIMRGVHFHFAGQPLPQDSKVFVHSKSSALAI